MLLGMRGELLMGHCLNCGELYATEPKHDYGYCSDRCEMTDRDWEEPYLTTVDAAR